MGNSNHVAAGTDRESPPGCSQVADSRIDRDLADSWADQMMETAEKDPKNLILVIADMARSTPHDDIVCF